MHSHKTVMIDFFPWTLGPSGLFGAQREGHGTGCELKESALDTRRGSQDNIGMLRS